MSHMAADASQIYAGWQPLRQAVHDCTACPLRGEARLPVPGVLPLGMHETQGVRVIVVGRNPGRQEDEQNVPFIGPSGRLLNTWLHMAGLSREWETAVTNLTKCYTIQNREPEADYAGVCVALHLRAELALLRPQLLIGFGVQVRDLLGEGEWTRTVKHVDGKVATFFTYHPSAILRSKKMEARWHQDAETVRRWLEENPQ